MASTSGRLALWPEFQELWERLVEASREPGSYVVVEGERDRRAVRRLGLDGEVLLVHHGSTLSGVAHQLSERARRVIVLTDWDAEGGHLAHRLGEFLGPMAIELDLDTRRRLSRLLRGELTHVEGLYGWARRTAEAAGAPIELWLQTLERDAGPAVRG